MLNSLIKYLWISLAALLFSSCDHCSQFVRTKKKVFMDKSFSGYIDTIFLDEKDRNSPKLKVHNSQILYNILGYELEQFKIGDSIVKKKGTLALELYKPYLISEQPIIILPKCNGWEFE